MTTTPKARDLMSNGEREAAESVEHEVPSDREAGTPPSSEGDHGSEAAAEVVVDDLAALEQERSDLVDTLRRVQADFENYRKRVIREQTELTERATERLVEQLLPVLDSFELAIANVAGADENVRKGVELLYAELLAVLEKQGLTRIEATGEAFDPNRHEAVMQSEGDGDPVVAETMRTGYTLKERVLRPSMVRVERR